MKISVPQYQAVFQVFLRAFTPLEETRKGLINTEKDVKHQAKKKYNKWLNAVPSERREDFGLLLPSLCIF